MLLLLLLSSPVVDASTLRPSFKEYTPVPIIGKYLIPPSAPSSQKRFGAPLVGPRSSESLSYVPAVFLGPISMQVVDLDDKASDDGNRVIERRVAKALIPIPLLRQDVEFTIGHSIGLLKSAGEGAGAVSSSTSAPSTAVVTGRDGGIMDNVRFIFSEGGEIGSAVRLNALLGMRNSITPTPASAAATSTKVMKALVAAVAGAKNPYVGCIQALQDVLGLSVQGLLLEVADRPNEKTIFVGGAVLLGPGEGQYEWSADNALSIIRLTQQRPLEGSTEPVFVKCHTDEVVGMALALQSEGPQGLPIVIARSVSEQLEMDVLLQQRTRQSSRENDEGIAMTGPFFPSKAARDLWLGVPNKRKKDEDKERERKEEEREEGGEGQERKEGEQTPPVPTSPPPPPATAPPQLIDASIFLGMSLSDRRAWLRSQSRGSSNSAMPRPREGTLALNAACYAFLDINVVYEVLRRLAESDGDEAAAAAVQDFESKKPAVAKAILLAQAEGDAGKVSQLTARLQKMGKLPYHPFKPNLFAVEDGFDVEEWYFVESRSLQGQRNIG